MRSRAPKPAPKPAPGPPRPAKPGLHPRNRHAGGYDFPQLVKVSPDLAPFVVRAIHGGPSIDFADPAAVKALNRALLLQAYGVRGWELPPGYLCPPVPGRADYLHHLADLLAASNGGAIPRGPGVRVLDVGVGANAIYPLVGHGEYGWSFVGSDIDAAALASAARILAANPGLETVITLRRQPDRGSIFAGVLDPGERFDLTLCNPPFHGSLREAREGTQRKWRNLGRGASAKPLLNFGGQGVELWCEGGEAGFARRMVAESQALGTQVLWFTTLLSSSASLPAVHRALRQAGAEEIRIVPMAQGQKQSRFVAWTFLPREAREAWRSRWEGL
ncbi:ribosomal RNA large subunit methyltransferase F [Geothrix oryzae]|uniref:Ribosomal RNA large subunit methyltransferase F n=1 Tax=Geothrix oryzae TaxID=2927975 RepID=A0ABM8DN98_9BACT|nr:23S rRNA (adenine(1618)-N(6))-methyltransferase RlmF [Geothrix oryzae]BDU68383.1 ribosomal RNA large subunit methyltransferase F [Geothrix oryzae]